MNKAMSTCCTCNYQWRTGTHGGHSCSEHLLKRITELEALLKARDGGGHEMRCMFNNVPPSEENYCTCGHDAVAKYFEGVGK